MGPGGEGMAMAAMPFGTPVFSSNGSVRSLVYVLLPVQLLPVMHMLTAV